MHSCSISLTRLLYSTFPGTGQIDWVGRCHNLTKLYLDCSSNRPIPLQRFAELAQMSTWPLLEDLYIGSTSGTDKQLSTILYHLPPLKRWTLESGDLGLASAARLQDQHFDGLMTLRMLKVETFTSPMALQVLLHYSQLGVFEAPRISLVDFRMFPQPWVCRRLWRPVVFFAITATTSISKDDDGRTESLFFEQLSKPEQLEEIDVSQPIRYGYQPIYEPAPQWRLDRGLAQLSILSRPQRLTCDNTKQTMRVEDVGWMLTQWPLFRQFSWCISPDRNTQRLISAMLKKRRVFT